MNVHANIVVDEIEELYRGKGHKPYGEVVTLFEHSLLTAQTAEHEGADEELIAACLLHDIGHLLVEPDNEYGKHTHDLIGADWLARHFRPGVSEPPRHHVAAKRYLCAIDPGYHDLLSPASQYTLTKQGGPMTPTEIVVFEQLDHHDDAVQLRRWEDALGKIADVPVPSFLLSLPPAARESRHPMTAGGLPRYLQIVEDLLDRIERGDLAPTDRLPPERSLSEEFSVNRRTLRHALDVLERRGLIERRQGAGTFVANPRFERQAAEFFPFTEGIRHRGFEPGSQIISLQRLLVSPSVADQLELTEIEEVWRFHRLRSVNGEPLLVETFSLPAALAPEIDTFDLNDRSVYDVLEDEYGVVVESARLSLEAVAISEFEAELLRVPIGSPAILERHLAFDTTGRPVDYGYDVYRGDRIRFVTDSATLPQDIPSYARSKTEVRR